MTLAAECGKELSGGHTVHSSGCPMSFRASFRLFLHLFASFRGLEVTFLAQISVAAADVPEEEEVDRWSDIGFSGHRRWR